MKKEKSKRENEAGRLPREQGQGFSFTPHISSSLFSSFILHPSSFILSFYRPQFLWALLFLAAVVAIHLLRRPRVKKLDFSTLRFFHEHAMQASRMRRLRRVLLLAARLLAVVAIIAIFAQPFDKNDQLGILRDPHLTVFAWADRTPSMGYVDRGRSLLDRSQALLDSLKGNCPATVRVLRYDEARGEFAPLDQSKGTPFKTRCGKNGLDAALRAFGEQRGNYSQPLLVLFSDFQKPTADDLDSLAHRSSGFPRTICVNLAPAHPWNFSIHDAELRDAGGTPRISVAVQAAGRKADSVDLSAGIGADPLSVRKRISLAAGDSSRVEFEAPGIRNAGPGWVALDGRDPMRFDDTDYVSRDQGASRIVVVGDPDRNFPVASALSAADAGRHRSISVVRGGELTYDALDSAEVVVINALDRSPRPFEALGRSHAFSGKVIVCAIAADSGTTGAFPSFIPVEAGAVSAKAAPSDVGAAIVLPDTISELWRGFPKMRSSDVSVYRYVEGLPGEPLLRLNNGAPVVTCLKDHDERVWLLFATPIGVSRANNLCETGFFVPCLDRLIRYGSTLTSRNQEEWTAGIEHRNPFYGSGKSAVVERGDGSFVAKWQSQPQVLFKEPGIYRIVPEGGQSWWVTVKNDPAESRLDYALPKLSDGVAGSVSVLSESQFLRAVHDGGRLPSYLPWILLALFLVAEILLWENPVAKNSSHRS